jgi:hypothetical protein
MLTLSGTNSGKNLSKEANTVSGGFKIDPKYENAKPKKKPLDPEVATRQEILECIGVVDPLIAQDVKQTLNNMNYKRKTKADVGDDICKDLETQIEKLKFQRIKMMIKEDPSSHDQLMKMETDAKQVNDRFKARGVTNEEIKHYQNVNRKPYYPGSVPGQFEQEEEEEEEDYTDPDVKKVLQDPTVERIELVLMREKEKLLELEKKYREKKEFDQLRSSSVNNTVSRVVQKSTIVTVYDELKKDRTKKDPNFFDDIKQTQSQMIGYGSPSKKGGTMNSFGTNFSSIGGMTGFNNTNNKPTENITQSTYVNLTGSKKDAGMTLDKNPLLSVTGSGLQGSGGPNYPKLLTSLGKPEESNMFVNSGQLPTYVPKYENFKKEDSPKKRKGYESPSKAYISPSREKFDKYRGPPAEDFSSNVMIVKEYQDDDVRGLVERSQKVRMIDPKQKNWQSKYNEYQTNKK